MPDMCVPHGSHARRDCAECADMGRLLATSGTTLSGGPSAAATCNTLTHAGMAMLISTGHRCRLDAKNGDGGKGSAAHPMSWRG